MIQQQIRRFRACLLPRFSAILDEWVCIGLVLALPSLTTAQTRQAAGPGVTPVEFNGDLRMLPQLPEGQFPTSRRQLPRLEGPPNTKPNVVVEPSVNVPLAPMPSPIQNFSGLSFSDGGAGWPPDTNGDVGPNHYVEAVNDAYAIFNKTGTRLAAFTENTLWSGVGSSCDGNSQGDSVVVYDQLHDRWILTHLAFPLDKSGNPTSPFYECIAVSKTGDPVSGGWWFYPFRMDPGGTGWPPVSTLNDYPKFGIWNDGCLYMSANEFTEPAEVFTGTIFVQFNLIQMEAGAAVTWGLGLLGPSGPFTMIRQSSGQFGGRHASPRPAKLLRFAVPKCICLRCQTTHSGSNLRSWHFERTSQCIPNFIYTSIRRHRSAAQHLQCAR